MNGNFELFCCCLGNGITVCNKAVTESGDYKYIAHISEGGNITLYVTESYIPAAEMEKIKKMALRRAAEFKSRFENLSLIEQYGKIINSIPHQKFMEAVKDKRPLTEKFPTMREYYYSIV